MPINVRSALFSVATAAFISFILIISYTYYNGNNEYNLALDALDLKDNDNAIVHFARAIGWYLPNASYFNKSIDSMMAIAKGYEENSRDEDAKYVYNLLRGSIYSVRSTYTPASERLAICNEKIAKLSAKSVTEGSGHNYLKTKEEFLDFLRDNDKPDIFWSSFASIFFIGWTLSTLFLIMILFKNNVVNFNKNAIILLIMLSTFYILWLISLKNA